MPQDTPQRSDYRWFLPITTRWMDNDVYGHVNNAHYYSWFDTIANTFLIEQGGLDAIPKKEPLAFGELLKGRNHPGDQVIGFCQRADLLFIALCRSIHISP